MFETVYRPAMLTAVDDGGNESSVLTPGDCARLHVRTSESRFTRPGQLAYVEIALKDEICTLRTFDSRQVTVNVKGARLAALGSADRRSKENYFDTSCRFYEGRAMAAIISEGQNAEIRVSAPGTEEVRLIIPFTPEQEDE